MADPDLSKLSTEDLQAIRAGDMSKVSDGGLRALAGPGAPSNTAVLGNSIAKGVASFGDMIGNMGVNVVNLGKAAVGTLGHALGMKAEDMPDLSDPDTLSGWKKAMQAAGVITPENEPQGSGQRVLDMVGQTLGGGGVNPRAIGTNLAKGAIAPVVRDLAAAGASGTGAGVARELAGNIHTGNDDADRALKLAATLAGGMAPAAIPAAMGTAGERAGAATANMKPEDWALAKALQDRNNAAGAPPLTGFEAIQGVTGKNPKQQTIQRVAEQSDEANQPGGLTDMMAKRAAGNQAYFGKVADTISPAQQSGTLGGELQTTAQDALDAARKSGNAQAAPAYAASSNNPAVKIPSSAWNGLASDPAVAWALQKVKDNPLGGLQNAQEGSLQWLDAAKKFLDEQGENLSNAQPGADRNRYFGGNAKAASKLITSTVDPLVPEYAQARQIVSDNLKNVVTPMQQSPVGKLTRSDDFAQQAGTLLPEKPMDQGPGVTANVVKTLTAQDPSIVRRFTAQYLRDMMNEANQQGSGGLNVRGGANFAGKVAGNPTQESNLMTAVNGGGAPINPLAQALESFRAQGMKPEVNSATTTNAAESGALNKTSLWAYHPIMAAGAAIPAAIDKLRLGIGAKEMAKALAAPDSVGEIMKMARANGTYSPMKQQILANLLNATRQTAATPGPSQ